MRKTNFICDICGRAVPDKGHLSEVVALSVHRECDPRAVLNKNDGDKHVCVPCIKLLATQMGYHVGSPQGVSKAVTGDGVGGEGGGGQGGEGRGG